MMKSCFPNPRWAEGKDGSRAVVVQMRGEVTFSVILTPARMQIASMILEINGVEQPESVKRVPHANLYRLVYRDVARLSGRRVNEVSLQRMICLRE